MQSPEELLVQATAEYFDAQCYHLMEVDMRFDGVRYRDCRWCAGSGCLYCSAERDKDYKRAFPDGPKPIATFQATEEGFEAARQAIGAEALKKAFGPGGGGLSEILQNIAKSQGDSTASPSNEASD